MILPVRIYIPDSSMPKLSAVAPAPSGPDDLIHSLQASVLSLSRFESISNHFTRNRLLTESE